MALLLGVATFISTNNHPYHHVLLLLAVVLLVVGLVLCGPLRSFFPASF
jgi:hypothetical protein